MPTLRNFSAVWLLHLLSMLIVVCLVAMPTGAQSKLPSALPAQGPDKAVIDKFISGQATELGGEENGKARKAIAGDINNDGVSDLAVLYTIEGVDGGNNYTQYLAVFVRLQGVLVPIAHTEVGGKGNRSVGLESIRNNVIVLTTLSYGPDDPMCCPSKKGTARFVLANGKLVSQ
jgi:hypothetical protein